LTPGRARVILAVVKLPEHVPVMTLPNALLFPRVLLPLHIFESRYKRMLADCLEGERLFAVALLRPPATCKTRRLTPYPVAGVGLIRTCLAKPDGAADLVLQGVARVRILEYVQLRPYRVARVVPLASYGALPDAGRRPLVAAVTRLARARAKLGVEVPRSVLDSLLAVKNADHFSDLISYTLLDDCYDKQAMLETLDVGERIHKLTGLVGKQIEQFNLWKTLQGKLPNKHVGHN
jgi:Lon protease-like protein